MGGFWSFSRFQPLNNFNSYQKKNDETRNDNYHHNKKNNYTLKRVSKLDGQTHTQSFYSCNEGASRRVRTANPESVPIIKMHIPPDPFDTPIAVTLYWSSVFSLPWLLASVVCPQTNEVGTRNVQPFVLLLPHSMIIADSTKVFFLPLCTNRLGHLDWNV